MTRYRVKTALLLITLVVLVVEGYLLLGFYGALPESATPSPEGTTDLAALRSDEAENRKPPETTSPEDRNGFVHRATDGNSRGDFTYLSDPRLDGNPDAVVLATPRGSYDRNIGVWYERRKGKWAIFNQDLAPVPSGSAFEVAVPGTSGVLVHRAGPSNTVGNATYLDDAAFNGRPDIDPLVTQNWNPGGSGGVYNDHPVGVLYDRDVDRWLIYNTDGARVPEGAAFNVAAKDGSTN